MFKTALRKTLAVPRAVFVRIRPWVSKLLLFPLVWLTCTAIGAVSVGMLVGSMGLALGGGVAFAVLGWQVGAVAGLLLAVGWTIGIAMREIRPYFGLINPFGRIASAALNRAKVWLT